MASGIVPTPQSEPVEDGPSDTNKKRPSSRPPQADDAPKRQRLDQVPSEQETRDTSTSGDRTAEVKSDDEDMDALKARAGYPRQIPANL